MQKKRKPKQEIFNLSEAAAYMGCGTEMILRLLNGGMIPGQQVGERYFIPKKGIDNWAMKCFEKKKDVSIDYDYEYEEEEDE